MEQNNQSYLATEKVGKLMQKYAIPCIISLLVAALYNIVDQIFIANASYLGSYGNAANTVVFPLTVIALAIAVMIGDGCCAFVSLSLGKKMPKEAGKSVGNSVVLTVVLSVVLTAVYLIFSDQIIAMFGGTVNAETFQYSKEYFFYITLGILHFPWYSFLYVWTGHESDHPCGWQSEICHGFYPGRCGDQYYSGPDFYFRMQVGDDGCRCCHSYRTGSNSCAGSMVLIPYT